MKRAYDVKRKRVVHIESMTKDGAILQYTIPNKPGQIFTPLIGANGKNVEPFEIIGQVE